MLDANYAVGHHGCKQRASISAGTVAAPIQVTPTTGADAPTDHRLFSSDIEREQCPPKWARIQLA